MALGVNPSPHIQLQSVSEARLGVITTIMCPPFPITTDGRPVLQTTNAAESFYIYLLIDENLCRQRLHWVRRSKGVADALPQKAALGQFVPWRVACGGCLDDFI